MSDRKHTVEHEGLWWVVACLFLFFWLAHGFERVDCALGVQKACVMIAAKYEEEAK